MAEEGIGKELLSENPISRDDVVMIEWFCEMVICARSGDSSLFSSMQLFSHLKREELMGG